MKVVFRWRGPRGIVTRYLTRDGDTFEWGMGPGTDCPPALAHRLAREHGGSVE